MYKRDAIVLPNIRKNRSINNRNLSSISEASILMNSRKRNCSYTGSTHIMSYQNATYKTQISFKPLTRITNFDKSVSCELLPMTIKHKFRYKQIKKRFRNMEGCTKWIPENDPLECMYDNLPYIANVLKDNRERKKLRLMRTVNPVYEEQPELCETLRKTLLF